MKVNNPPALNRRSFLKLAALGWGGLIFPRWNKALSLPVFPAGDLLGRVNVGKVDLKVRPDVDSQTVGGLYEDSVVPWLRELVGKNIYRTNQRWVETPDGYIWSPYLQPVWNIQNTPVEALPISNNETGMWVEVSLPYVDLTMDNPPPRSPGLQSRQKLGLPPRLYYSQIVWVDQIKTDDQGQVWYRVNERYGSYGDILWGAAEAFRSLTTDEIAPISPAVEGKSIVVNITYQTLSCFEGSSEVYFARISSGALFNANGERVDTWATPIGKFPIWRKLVSLHMSGGTTGGGWDLLGIGWTSLFVGSGVAIHSTFWHNNFGEPMSRGCVNARPEDAKWIFRWTQPVVSYNPGDTTVAWPGGTQVKVIEA
jgi:hypothetical protein